MSNEKKKGFWCVKCHYGSERMKLFNKCPQCGAERSTEPGNPFPVKPVRQGNGDSGKTGRTPGPNKGKIDPKIERKLKARNTAIQNAKDKAASPKVRGSMHLAGSMKKVSGQC